MNGKMTRKLAGVLGTLLLLGTGFSNASAQKSYTKANADARKQTAKAAAAFKQIMGVPDKAIPKELLDKAEAVAVCPDVIKAGILLVGGRGGRCVISRRIAGGWSAPAFFNLGGGSIGPQIGASSTDFVLLFMNEGALGGLLEDKFELGGEAGVAAGPIGRTAAASTDAQLKAGILTYSRSKGAFIGAELKGVVINPDNNDNEGVYGIKANEVLSGKPITRKGKAWMPQSVKIFPLTLARYSLR
ncbi:MAG TPA: lipid-binding SYLF domain-containing protein [Pyrinomonadaceae bacterium]|jgi:lipid-binding SYLF domain-containing protein